MVEKADIVVVGGGPVGAAAALALAQGGVVPMVLELREVEVTVADPRPLALSYGSRLILERLGVWEALGPATPIERIHVSQQGGFGRITLTAAEARLPALGYVVEYARLHAALARAVACGNTRVVAGARVSAVKPGHETATVEFTLGGTERAVCARLVVVADGGTLQELAQTRTVDYRQTAVVAAVQSELPHQNMAFERFTSGGPLALLPRGNGLALVWTVDPKFAQELCEQPADEFSARLYEQFGTRLGALTAVGPRSAFPLALRVARDTGLPHVVLIGNASQTLHPVAGQGFNLGLRDAWELADELVRAEREAIGSIPMLAAYRTRRRIDRRGGIWFTDSLVRLFSNDVKLLRGARGVGLALLGCLPPAKDFVIRRMTFGARG